MEEENKKDVELDEVSDLEEDMELDETEKEDKKEDDKKESKEKEDKEDKEDDEEPEEKKEKKSSKKKDDDDDLEEDEEGTGSLVGKIILALIVIAVIVVLLLRSCGNTATYEITFDTNGGSPVSTLKVKKDGTITKPADPTKEGYVFDGWYYNDEKFDFSTKVTKDMKLDARWTEAANAAVDGVTLNQEEIALEPGNTATLIATVSPEDAKNKSLTWTSSDEGIVTVDENGNITAVKAGTATITVTTEDGGYTATCTVKVQKGVVAVTGVSLSGTSIEVATGYTATLKATIKPSDATNKTLTWTSSDTSIASVNSKGVVTGKKEGTVTITVKTADGGYTAEIKVTVKNQPVTGVSISGGKSTMTVGDKGTLKATIKPSNATNKKVTWKSNHNDIVSVDSKGNIKALAPGTATITVTTDDGQKTATFKITVKEKPSTYTITFTALKDALGNINQYEIYVTKDGKQFEEYTSITYNGNTRPFKQSNKVDVKYVDTSKKTATINLKDGSTVKVTNIKYTSKNI